MSSLLRWPLGRRESGTPSRATIQAIYGAIVAQARRPEFFDALGVPDTVEGRFDMVLLHLWITLRSLRSRPDGDALAQALFDEFCNDMDANLREMGVGDLAVPKRMRAFGEAFYGRMKAYDAAYEGGMSQFAASVARNVYGDPAPGRGERLAAYADAALATLDAADEAAVRNGALPFGEPTP